MLPDCIFFIKCRQLKNSSFCFVNEKSCQRIEKNFFQKKNVLLNKLKFTIRWNETLCTVTTLQCMYTFVFHFYAIFMCAKIRLLWFAYQEAKKSNIESFIFVELLTKTRNPRTHTHIRQPKRHGKICIQAERHNKQMTWNNK